MAYVELGKSAAPVAHDSGGMLSIVNRLLEHWRRIFGSAIAVGIITALLLFFGSADYTADGSFIPEVQPTGSITGLAAQFGLETGESPTESADFYADLLKSRTIIDPLLLQKFTIPDGKATRTATLLDLLKVKGNSQALRMESGVREMKRRVVIIPNRRTSVVKVQATTDSPDLSYGVVRQLIGLVGDFNLNKRQSRARIERTFLMERLAVARADLRTAEDAFQEYVERNRRYRESPSTVFVAERLERDVKERESVYSTIQSNLEHARVEEVRRTPVITIVDSARVPARRDPKGTIAFSAAMAIAALVVTSFAILAYDWLYLGAASGDPQRVALYGRFRGIQDSVTKRFRRKSA